MDKLLPCPFCGKPPKMHIDADLVDIICCNPECEMCEVSVVVIVNDWNSQDFEDKTAAYREAPKAIAIWNKRAEAK